MDPSRRFEGKVAVVTGAGSGIGRATATRLAAEGALVACLDVAEDRVDALARQLCAASGTATAVHCDVADEGSVGRAFDRLVAELGPPEVVCNVAGVGGFHHTTELSLDEWHRVLGVNLTGTFLVCRQALPYLLDRSGVIVNVASTAGLIGQPYSAAYCASKGGVVMLTRALALEFLDRGVRVNAVAPGGVDTPLLSQFALPEGANPKLISRIMSPKGYAIPEQIAAAICFLASVESGYTTGSVFVVDGGLTA
jgi:NAD(P)-dependent dehydrogenase (short-subunit alcohol dehydrogenase family)